MFQNVADMDSARKREKEVTSNLEYRLKEILDRKSVV